MPSNPESEIASAADKKALLWGAFLLLPRSLLLFWHQPFWSACILRYSHPDRQKQSPSFCERSPQLDAQGYCDSKVGISCRWWKNKKGRLCYLQAGHWHKQRFLFIQKKEYLIKWKYTHPKTVWQGQRGCILCSHTLLTLQTLLLILI